MSVTNQATLTTVQDTIFGDLKKNWGWLLALGISSIVLGTLGFGEFQNEVQHPDLGCRQEVCT
jgi:uncharacterized membrane protein HdeD (DUF308 family)